MVISPVLSNKICKKLFKKIYFWTFESTSRHVFFFIFIIRHQSYGPELADLLFRLIRTYLNIAL